MSDYSYYTMGTWTVTPGHRDEFVAAWAQFAEWATSLSGAGKLRLNRDLDDPERFHSFGEWDSAESIRSWKGSEEFREQLALVMRHVEKLDRSNVTVVVTADDGTSVVHALETA